MRFLVTGANGFIGKNLCLRLQELDHTVIKLCRSDTLESLADQIHTIDGVFHLAGENRPVDPAAFQQVNSGLTSQLCDLLTNSGKSTPVILASSAQAELDNHYGLSKLAAEQAVTRYATQNGAAAMIYRLPGVFGKWAKPNYNSVVATFCHNIANDQPIQISDPSKLIDLVYIDDVVDGFISEMSLAITNKYTGSKLLAISNHYQITLGDLADQIRAFQQCRTTLISERVGTGFTRVLYASYVSYLPISKFSYDVPVYGDSRGVFVEMLKTIDSGQFSFFTAHPGITRGGHYHHTKTEKFLVIKGRARFGFRNVISNELHHIDTSGEQPQVVETVPGWTHDITNVGEDELVVMLWANEIFDRAKPDTTANKV